MIISIVLNGRIRNKVIEKNIADDQLVAYLTFVNTHGLFVEDSWYPSQRIKEVLFGEHAAPMQSRRFTQEDKD